MPAGKPLHSHTACCCGQGRARQQQGNLACTFPASFLVLSRCGSPKNSTLIALLQDSCTPCFGLPCTLLLLTVMLCHAMPCYAMPCHAMLCHAMPCYAMLCHAMPRYAMLCYGCAVAPCKASWDNAPVPNAFSWLAGSHLGSTAMQRQKVDHRKDQEERIDCVCGVTDSTPAAEQYSGLWLRCDECMSWLHGACVGYPKRPPRGKLSATWRCRLCQQPMFGPAILHTLQALQSPCSATNGVQSFFTNLCPV